MFVLFRFTVTTLRSVPTKIVVECPQERQASFCGTRMFVNVRILACSDPRDHRNRDCERVSTAKQKKKLTNLPLDRDSECCDKNKKLIVHPFLQLLS